MQWIIMYEKYSNAVKRAYSTVAEFLDYAPKCVELTEETKDLYKENNVVFLGKTDKCPYPQGGYRIKTFKTENEGHVIVLTGDGDINLLYASVDFRNKFLPKALYTDSHGPYYLYEPFKDPVPEYDFETVPAIKNRALWTWGYVIYDYKKYIDNMVSLKLNMLVMWNDYPPINAKEIIKYAHENGVKVIWGFSWGWDTADRQKNVVDNNIDNLSENIIKKYVNEYADLGGDGIYFQSFTESKEEKIGDLLIADAVTKLVNETSEKLLALYPDLDIQFGLHATSVKEKLEYIKRVNPKISIIWEDCGAFPYAYVAKDIDNFDKTAEFTEDIMNLRDSGFGVVLKGLTCLNWLTFKHQPGPFILGEYNQSYKDNRLITKRKIWKYVQAYWIRNAKYAYDIIAKYDENSVVQALVEDGMFVEKLWYPVALYAEMLWNNKGDFNQIMSDVALIPDVYFA